MKKANKRPPPPRRRPVKAKPASQPTIATAKSTENPDAILFTHEICAKQRICKVTLWRWIRSDRFPPPRVMGGRNVWTVAEYKTWFENRDRREYTRDVA